MLKNIYLPVCCFGIRNLVSGDKMCQKWLKKTHIWCTYFSNKTYALYWNAYSLSFSAFWFSFHNVLCPDPYTLANKHTKALANLNKHSFIGFIALQNQSRHFNIKGVNHLSEANRNRKKKYKRQREGNQFSHIRTIILLRNGWHMEIKKLQGHL